MSHKIVVGYDGSDSAGAALDFAMGVAKAHGGSVVVAHVLEWSPYAFLTPTEIEERHKRRTEELKRAEEALLAPVIARLAASGVAVSTALKFGHIAETLCAIAKEEGRFGVRANSVALGVIDAGMFHRLVETGELNQAYLDASKRNIALRRFGRAEEVAEAVAFLSSSRASYITGQTLMLDGGYSI